MTKKAINKCCQEYPAMVKKVRETARINNRNIYLNQQERDILITWMENNKVEISNCSHCWSLIKSWIENNYIIPESAFPQE